MVRLGFDAQLADRYTIKYDVLVRFDGLHSKHIQVRAAPLSPWYVRCRGFADAADQVTVYVLLGDKNRQCARFFPTRNGDVAGYLRQPSNWTKFGLVDIATVERHENNWNILRVNTE